MSPSSGPRAGSPGAVCQRAAESGRQAGEWPFPTPGEKVVQGVFGRADRGLRRGGLGHVRVGCPGRSLVRHHSIPASGPLNGPGSCLAHGEAGLSARMRNAASVLSILRQAPLCGWQLPFSIFLYLSRAAAIGRAVSATAHAGRADGEPIRPRRRSWCRRRPSRPGRRSSRVRRAAVFPVDSGHAPHVAPQASTHRAPDTRQPALAVIQPRDNRTAAVKCSCSPASGGPL